MRQFNHTRLHAHLLLLQERQQFPQILPIVVIANRDMNGDARSSKWLHKPEKLFVLGFFSITKRTVAIDDQVSRPRIECKDALGSHGKAPCHIDAFMLALPDGRSRPLGPWEDAIWIGADVCICKQSHTVWV